MGCLVRQGDSGEGVEGVGFLYMRASMGRLSRRASQVGWSQVLDSAFFAA